MQKLVIYCIVKPRYNSFIAMCVTSAQDFNMRVNNLELYRIHRFCEGQGMSIGPLIENEVDGQDNEEEL